MHEHKVQFYQSEEVFMDLLVSWSKERLTAGGSCLILVSGTHRTLLHRRLSSLGLISDRCVLVDVEEALSELLIDGQVCPVRFSALFTPLLQSLRFNGTGEVFVVGEGTSLLLAQNRLEEALRVEEFWDAQARENNFPLLCLYPTHLFFEKEYNLDAMLKVCAEHSKVDLPNELWPSRMRRDTATDVA